MIFGCRLLGYFLLALLRGATTEVCDKALKPEPDTNDVYSFQAHLAQSQTQSILTKVFKISDKPNGETIEMQLRIE